MVDNGIPQGSCLGPLLFSKFLMTYHCLNNPINEAVSTVKRRLRDAGLLGRVPLFSVYVLLPILIFNFYWPVWDIAFSLQLCLEGQCPGVTPSLLTVGTGVLREILNEAASWGLVRRLFLKLDTLMYLSSSSVVHRGLPLLFLFWLKPVCAVLWRE